MRRKFRNGRNGMTTVFLAGALVAAGLVFGDRTEPQASRKGSLYPLSTCPVSGAKLGAMGEPVVYLHHGREIRFCCKGCVPKFKKDPDKYLRKIDAGIIKTQKPYYPLSTCLVTGEALGDKPVDHVWGNRLVRLCCQGCIKKLDKDPAKYTKKLDRAVAAKQGPSYTLTTCVVSGVKLSAMGKPVDYVFSNRLVRFCCKGCIKKFEKDPAEYTKKLPKVGGSVSTTAKSETSGRGCCGRGGSAWKKSSCSKAKSCGGK